MSAADNADKWTPDRLETHVDRAIHLEQRRAQLQPIVDDLRRLAREMQAKLKEAEAIEGDFPGQSRIRAWNTARPLFKAADDVEKALADLVSFNARFQRSYEDLPDKREEKRQRKALAKGGQQQAIASPPPAGEQAASPSNGQYGGVFDGLRKGA
ncbi:hypothetical protein ACFCX6_31780 [Streptomyces sp. NPDC056353]|uniref:hypothetical protein n=1 Tax=Streptomyces sp. NPDC056353 TaxID=3345792 RepID=UPI0035DB07BE